MKPLQPTFDLATSRWLDDVNRQVATVAHRVGRRNYAAGARVARKPGWVTSSMSANADIHASLDTVRARSRQLAKDSPHMRKYLAMVANNVIGPAGMRLQARALDGAQMDALANAAIEEAWARFGARGVCEASGKHSMLSLCHMLAKTAPRDGECLIRFLLGANARNDFGIALQVLDVDRLDTQFNRQADGTSNAIRMGVEIDSFMRPVAYHFRNRHPGDPYTTHGQGNERLRIPADEIIHMFVADRPEQVRGMPWGHAVIAELDDLGAFRTAAQFAARFGAEKGGFFTSPADDDAGAAELASGIEVPGGEADGESEGGGQYVMDSEPGKYEVLPNGFQFQQIDTKYPSDMYGDFIKEGVRDVATGLCVAYHSLGNNLEGVSFSSIRSGTLEDRDAWMVLQAWFVDEFMDRVFDRWLAMALAMGQVTLPNGSALPLRNLEKFRRHVWMPRRWEWVDPKNDIEADLAAVRAGLKAPQDVAAKLGQDYEDTLRKIKQARDMADLLGVPISWQSTPQQAQQQPGVAQPQAAT